MINEGWIKKGKQKLQQIPFEGQLVVLTYDI